MGWLKQGLGSFFGLGTLQSFGFVLGVSGMV